MVRMNTELKHWMGIFIQIGNDRFTSAPLKDIPISECLANSEYFWMYHYIEGPERAIEIAQEKLEEASREVYRRLKLD